MNQEVRETLANFRFSLIAPLVTRKLSKGERQKILAELSGQTHLTPKGECKSFSVRTLERYVAAYEKEGPTGLIPKVRKDAAHCRVIPPDLLDKAVALKLEAPARSVQQIIRILELTGSCPEDFLKPSTLSNHLYEAEAVLKLLDGSKEACRRYEMAYRNQVWHSQTPLC